MRAAVALLLLAGACMAVGPKELVIKPAGVVTDPNPHSAAPKGALRKATNCIMERDGILQPRPGFESDAIVVEHPARLQPVNKLIPFDGDLIAVLGSSHTGWIGTETFDDIQRDFAGSDFRLSWNDGYIRSAQMRRNLYLSTQDGVRKVSESGQTNAKPSGAPRPFAITADFEESGVAIEAGMQAAYRAVVSRTDASDLVSTSPPTGRAIVVSGGASDSNTSVTVHLPFEVAEGDVVEFYRTRNFDGTPDDECYLVKEVELDEDAVDDLLVTVIDDVDDDDLGRALYTNPSRGGALVYNHRPHAAKDLAEYRGSMFFANTLGPRRITLSFDEEDGNLDHPGAFNIEGDVENGSDTMTNVSSEDIELVRVGQLVFSLVLGADLFDGLESQQVYVTEVGADSVTFSRDYAGTTGASSLTLCDSLRISTRRYPAFSVHALILGFAGKMPEVRATLASSDFFAYAVGDSDRTAMSGGSLDGRRKTVVIEQMRRGPLIGGAGFANYSLQASKGEAYFPPLPLDEVDTWEDSKEIEADERLNGIQWSKIDQPEHVPEVNFVAVGSDREPIQRIVPARDALWIFKTDGIWRLSGFGADAGWRVDPIDMGTFLLAPETAQVLNESIYAWTNRGVVRIDDSGVSPVSTQYIGRELLPQERDATPNLNDDPPKGFAFVVEDRNSYFLALPSEPDEGESERVWVWNTKTMAWTTWDLQWRAGVYNPQNGLISGAGSEVVGSHEGSNIYETSLHTEQKDTESPEEVTSIVEFTTRTAGAPSIGKHWRNGVWMFEQLEGVESLAARYSDGAGGGLASQDLAIGSTTEETPPDALRSSVPRAHARMQHLFPRIDIVGGTWELSGVALSYRMTSSRGRR